MKIPSARLSFIISALLASTAAAAAPRTEKIDGNNSFEPDERLRMTNMTPEAPPGWFLTWDDTALTIGSVANDIDTNQKSADHYLYVYFSTAPERKNPRSGPGSAEGAPIGNIGLSPRLAFNATWHFRYRLDGGEQALMAFKDGSWKPAKWTGALQANPGSRFIEFSIPWADIGGKPDRLNLMGAFAWAGSETGWNFNSTPDFGNTFSEGIEGPDGTIEGGGASNRTPEFQGYWGLPLLAGVAPGTRGFISSYPIVTSGKGGKFSDPATWEGGIVPGGEAGPRDHAVIRGGHKVVADANITSLGAISVLPKGAFTADAVEIKFPDRARIESKGDFDGGKSTILTEGGLIVRGNVSFNNITAGGRDGALAPLDFGSSSRIEGTLELLRGGYIPVAPMAPTYGPASIIRYATGTDYGVFNEWFDDNAPTTAGKPGAIEVVKGTRLRFKGTATRTLPAGKGITVDETSAIMRQDGNAAMIGPENKIVNNGGWGERREATAGAELNFGTAFDDQKIKIRVQADGNGSLKYIDVARWNRSHPRAEEAERVGRYYLIDVNDDAKGYTLEVSFPYDQKVVSKPVIHRYTGFGWEPLDTQPAGSGLVKTLGLNGRSILVVATEK